MYHAYMQQIIKFENSDKLDLHSCPMPCPDIASSDSDIILLIKYLAITNQMTSAYNLFVQNFGIIF